MKPVILILALAGAALAQDPGPSPTASVGCEPHNDHWYVLHSPPILVYTNFAGTAMALPPLRPPRQVHQLPPLLLSHPPSPALPNLQAASHITTTGTATDRPKLSREVPLLLRRSLLPRMLILVLRGCMVDILWRWPGCCLVPLYGIFDLKYIHTFLKRTPVYIGMKVKEISLNVYTKMT